MPGLGRRTFAPGEVLTATNVMGYLQDQVVQVYAGTAARGSAIGTATSEGMASYLADTNQVQVAVGTATWVDVLGLPVAAGTATRTAIWPTPFQGSSVFRNDGGYIETYYGAYNVSTNPGGMQTAGWYKSGGAILHSEWTTSQTSTTNGGLSNIGTLTFDSTNSNATNLATYSSGVLTLASPGLYSVAWFGKATAGVTTGRTFALLYGNGAVEIDFNDVNSGENIFLGVNYPNYFASTAGQTLEIQLFQTSGSTRTVNGRLRLSKLS